MANKLEICNGALIKLGVRTILSLSDNVKSARLCNNRYNHSKRAVLRSHVWNFAKDRVTLSPLTATPAFGYGYQFQLPADSLRVVTVNGAIRDKTYQIEGRVILSAASTVELQYIKFITDDNLMDALASEALASYLAWDLSIPLTGDKELKVAMHEAYKVALRGAKSVDGQENSASVLEATEYIDSRYIGSSAVPATSKFPTSSRSV